MKRGTLIMVESSKLKVHSYSRHLQFLNERALRLEALRPDTVGNRPVSHRHHHTASLQSFRALLSISATMLGDAKFAQTQSLPFSSLRLGASRTAVLEPFLQHFPDNTRPNSPTFPP